MEYEIIGSCTLFRGLSDTECEYALNFFEARHTHYEKGDFLNRIGEPLQFFGLVLSGAVQVCMDDIDGQPVIMANVTDGETFGESLNFLQADTNVYIRAAVGTDILLMSSRHIHSLSPASTQLDCILANRFTAMLAERALAMNSRIQILSKLTLHDKLISFFSQAVGRSGSDEFDLPFDRSSMAVYLGTNRSALSRELSKMRREAIIAFKRNHFKVFTKRA